MNRKRSPRTTWIVIAAGSLVVVLAGFAVKDWIRAVSEPTLSAAKSPHVNYNRVAAIHELASDTRRRESHRRRRDDHMPSPFPGMDPYIEAPEIWSDFHADLAAEIRAALNVLIQPRYVARLTPLLTYEEVQIAQTRAVRPDVGVWQPQPPRDSAPKAGPAITQAPVESVVPFEVPLTLFTVEIREAADLELVTSIEILSPVNKRRGHEAFASYRRKRRQLLRSEAHLLELVLLRGGQRSPLERPVPPASYYATLSRAGRRPTVEVWPMGFRENLPVLPVPLAAPDPDVALELGASVSAVYERGAYARQIDYRAAPPPPELSEDDSAWLDELLRAKGLR